MNRSDKRPSPLTMASEKEHSNQSYLRHLKQNYARRKDIIELMKSNTILISVIKSLTEQLCRNGGHL